MKFPKIHRYWLVWHHPMEGRSPAFSITAVQERLSGSSELDRVKGSTDQSRGFVPVVRGITVSVQGKFLPKWLATTRLAGLHRSGAIHLCLKAKMEQDVIPKR